MKDEQVESGDDDREPDNEEDWTADSHRAVSTVAKISEAADHPIRPNRAGRRHVLSFSIDPYRKDPVLLRPSDIPIQIVANHPGIRRRHGHRRQRLVKD